MRRCAVVAAVTAIAGASKYQRHTAASVTRVTVHGAVAARVVSRPGFTG